MFVIHVQRWLVYSACMKFRRTEVKLLALALATYFSIRITPLDLEVWGICVVSEALATDEITRGESISNQSEEQLNFSLNI